MDMKTLLQDLREAGMTQEQIAAHCGCKQSSISEISTGKTKSPAFHIGFALIDLHKRKVRRKAKAA